MIPELGLFSLILALFAAIVQCSAPLSARYHLPATAMSRTSASLYFLAVTAALGALIISYADSDFTVANVVANSHSSKPLLYKIAGAWGNHEGSMLLWVWVLGLYGLMLALSDFRQHKQLKTYALAIQGVIATGALLFILFTSNPFERVFPPPPDGNDLNPLLQDISLSIHPPFLYLGYVGFSMVYSFALAGLLIQQIDRDWARLVRPWILGAWSLLTLGIGLGSWWAYRELGWGGWWFWDPVENVSLLPWLAATALLHSNLVLERRNILQSWVVLLAILVFILSLLGTFLVRSGLLTSVHSFANDPARGVFILCYITFIAGLGFLLYALKLPRIHGGDKIQLLSREGAILINNLLWVTACATVALGTLYPLGYEFFTGQKLSVGAPYFNSTFLPLLLPLLLLAGLAPVMSWKQADIYQSLYKLRYAGAATLAAICLVLFMTDRQFLLSAAGIGVSAWLAASTLSYFAQKILWKQVPWKESLHRTRSLSWTTYGVVMAHLGAALLVAGITGSSLWQEESWAEVKPGQTIEAAGFEWRYGKEKEHTESNYKTLQGSFRVTRQHNDIAELSPEVRYYPVRGSVTSEAAIHYTPLYDLYAVISKHKPETTTSARLYYTPLMSFVWMGFIFIAAGGMLAAIDGILRKRQPYP